MGEGFSGKAGERKSRAVGTEAALSIRSSLASSPGLPSLTWMCMKAPLQPVVQDSCFSTSWHSFLSLPDSGSYSSREAEQVQGLCQLGLGDSCCRHSPPVRHAEGMAQVV